VVANPDLEGIVVADTVPPFRLCSGAAPQKLTVVDSTGFAAEAIERFKGWGLPAGAPILVDVPEVVRFRLTVFVVIRRLRQPVEIDIRDVAA
jgi:hypothetical protein